ncbi:MAG: hypothetical protein KGN39_03060 [Betaproteobacteria bacterium]|nr:hypothetical protein [Betaproteobacteria bacterium]
MIDLGSTDFLIQVPSLPETELAGLSTSLFDSWESFVEGSLAVPDYSLFLQVEEGSIKGLAKTGALLYAVYLGIGNYGSFISGLQTINEQLNATRQYLINEVGRTFPCQEAKTSTRKRGGSLAALQRLFVKVQKGELTPDEAIAQAETLLGNEAATVPGFQRDLENALRTCPLFPEQLPLPLVDLSENDLQTLFDPKRPSRPARPRPVLGPTLQFRVEVWRESKKKRKETRIVRL